MRRSKYSGVLALIFVGIANTAANASDVLERFPRNPADTSVFSDALERERPTRSTPLPITGVTVPHHLLAADLIARGIWAAAGNKYDHIVVISPDHFRKSRLPIATTRRDFETAFGPTSTDVAAATFLIQRSDLVDDSDLFSQEHGITAVLPFLRAVFPDTPIVPIALQVQADETQWKAIVDLLTQIITPRTLIVQSTDYSHYLLPRVARFRDQETLNVISQGDPEIIADLRQADHLDSKAAQYVQMRLQRDVFGSHSAVLANRNSSEYTDHDAPSTSYVVTAYAKDPADLSQLMYKDQQTTFFGGDVFLGRGFNPLLFNSVARATIVSEIIHHTNGLPMVVNLEGVISDDPPIGVPTERHIMDDRLAGPILQEINATAAGLANNHSFDLGSDGMAASEKALSRRNIRGLHHMGVTDLGAFRLLTLNFVGSGDFKNYAVIAPDSSSLKSSIQKVCNVVAAPPLVALVHWGAEYVSSPRQQEKDIAERLASCGIDLVIGAHSHQASTNLAMVGSGQSLMVYSLGNFLFDQRSPRGSGALLELRVFKQGTFAARLIPIPNFYDLGAAANPTPYR
ncbi:AmmeMemoRadiSam system protein B [Bradyrhizobium erythrophlei]|uniref:Poly-gamma-glutamate synthesis protein (Capsule biosynthesis protein) n=1 Tax=Bradyrhizobium erythrophlei TaxID=1437360 RepID=A0A1M5M6H2_9BRAD|nr:AmmeMemoRadiSam system protein B [Bradyrhizobium erythrophlei]SHG72838.1 poly-gamma-glutamate synthesis protein (capsule biosynthesis protein) [Bradyrhizobium erythrophlei]